MASLTVELISETIVASVDSLREASTSFAPCSAASSAAANPMPLEAPVMTMTCWSRGFNEMAISIFLCRDSVRLLGMGEHVGACPVCSCGQMTAPFAHRFPSNCDGVKLRGCDRLRQQSRDEGCECDW